MNVLIQSTMEGFPGEIYSSILVVLIIFVICLIIFIKVRKTDPLAKPKGIVHLAEILVTTIDGMVNQYMSPKLSFLGGYFTAVAMYLFLGFTFSLFGLPSPTTYLMVPLIFALITFLLIHGVSVYYTKWKYFKRYTSPVIVFLPINLVTVWAPVLSLSFRLFGNALAGWVLMSIIYDALGSLSASIFSFLPAGLNSIFLAPLVTSWLHIYFDLISAFIQTMVFITLSMIFIGQEVPEDDIVKQAIAAPREA